MTDLLNDQKARYRKKCDRISADYGRMSRESRGLVYAWERHYRRLWQPHIRPGSRVLDIGCGSGAFSRFVEELGGRVWSADISLGMLRETVRTGLPRVCCMDSERLAVAGGAMDVVVTASSLAYLPDKRACLREVHRVLRAGGVFLILDMNPAFPGYARSRDAAQLAVRRQVAPRPLLDWLRESGFTVEDWRRMNWMPHKASGAAFHLMRLADGMLGTLPFLDRWSMRISYVARK